MAAVADLETLRRMMPPPSAPDTAVDWERLGRSWGKEFPPDYRQFMDAYGPGTVENFLVVERPEPRDTPSDPQTGGMAHETATARLLWRESGKEAGLAEVEPLLIAWGADAGADTLCWDASGDDPAAWPVLVYQRGDLVWRRYDCGIVEFLQRVLEADFDDCPLSGTNIWGVGTVKFLTPGEEKRLLKAGLDPWTGEPDPYAGMFPS
jgi:hypothetical protein